jgi:hypothetical protein
VVLWARENKTASGTRLLRENPLLGMAKRLKIGPNASPNQPIIDRGTFVAPRRAASRRRYR